MPPLKLFAAVEVHILLGKELDGHVIDGFNLLLQYDGAEECVDAEVALLVSVLGDEELHAAQSQAFGVLSHHVVAHDLHIAAVGPQQEIAHDVGS